MVVGGVMLALLGLAAAQCESGRLVETIQIPRYAPSCCAGESYIWLADVSSSQIADMRDKYVTVAPGTQPNLELPTPEYLINNSMTLQVREDGAQAYLSYTNYPADYPINEAHSGAVNYSIGANHNSDVYDQYSHGNGPAVFRIYVDECKFPPSSPPPPPVVAMCAEGYWPLYLTEPEAIALSPQNAAHTKEFYGIPYYMPVSMDGAMYGGDGVECPWHAMGLPPNAPPEPPSEPPPILPPLPPAPPPPPPPYELPVELQVLLITTIPAAILICIAVAWIWWCLYYSSPKGQQQIARENAAERRRFFKLEVPAQS